jgi:hypothetical protein
MSSTRRSAADAPLSYERYMSSPEFDDLRAISGTAVAKRCALLVTPAKRELLWFVQGLSLLQGGLNSLAEGLLKMFPDRCQRPDLALAKVSITTENAFETQWHRTERARSLPLTEFLIDLCINPARQIRLKGEDEIVTEFEAERATQEFGSRSEGELLDCELSYFKGTVAALFEYKRRYEQSVKAAFCQTAISRQVWKQLDDALKSKTMVVLDGR